MLMADCDETRTGVATEAADFESSVAPSTSVAGSVSEAERARCLEDKLHATLQILKNKEETVRVQAESLALAEARISSLAARASCAHLHRGVHTPLQRSSENGCKIEMTDVSVSAESQGSDEKMVFMLRDNLSVVEDLYRECFYETAKQEQLIEMLRRSLWDVRATELRPRRHAAAAQPSSAHTYQEVAAQVEHLKADISSFLDNSNNDSGVWEGGEAAPAPVSDELNHIVSQLHRLKEMLTGECTCGLDDENNTLKRKNEINEVKISELEQRVRDLEEALGDKESVDERFLTQIQQKELELKHIREQICHLDKGSREECCCDRLSSQLKEVQGLLDAKTSELAQAQQKCDLQEATIVELREKVNSDLISNEKSAVREEVSKLSEQVCSWREQLESSRRRLRELRSELQHARLRCRHLEHNYREKTDFAYTLQTQLEEAQTRGAKLCDEARHVVCAVKRCLWKQRQRQKDQEEKIKRQETLIRTLQSSQTESELMKEPCCSRSIDMRYVSASERGSSRFGSDRMSANETASSASPPTPPRRLLRKKPLRDVTPRGCAGVSPAPATRTRSAGAAECPHGCDARRIREISPTDELLERVERAQEALTHAHRRWCAHAHAQARAHASRADGHDS